MNLVEHILKEDLIHTDGNGSQYDWMQKSQPITISILDLLKVQSDGSDYASKILPYQINPIMDQLVDNATQAMVLKQQFSSVKSHPLIRDDEVRKAIINKINAKLNGIYKAYEDIANELDDLKLD